MTAKFKTGEILVTNNVYRKEGRNYFGKHLEHQNFAGVVEKVYENTNDQRDGNGDVWPNVYVFKGGLSFCERFLQRV